MGIPPNIEGIEHSTLYMRAYNHIYNTWFRDQNLQDSVTIDKGDGPDNVLDYVLLNRGKRHDYFTSSLPWPQKSDSGSVTIPLGTSAPITHDVTDGGTLGVISTVNSGDPHSMGADLTTVSASAITANIENVLYADLTEATAATINQLRQSIAVQRLFDGPVWHSVP